MPPEEPPRTEPGTLALVRGKRFNAHEKVIFQGDVRGKRFITHGRSNPRYKYLGRGILQFKDSVLSLPVK